MVLSGVARYQRKELRLLAGFNIQLLHLTRRFTFLAENLTSYGNSMTYFTWILKP